MKTSYYSNPALVDPNLIKVGVTAYPPRFKLRYERAGNIKLIAPAKEMLGVHDRDAFRPIYYAKLEAATVAAIRAEIQKYAVPGKEIVLLCYEKLDDGTRWCHRRLFAEWWESATGEKIEELGAKPIPDSLF